VRRPQSRKSYPSRAIASSSRIRVRADWHLSLAFALGHAAIAAGASAQTIRVGNNVLVSHGYEHRRLVEPHLAVHPSDSAHLLGVTIVSDSARAWGETQTCSTFLSLDGGRTWRAHDFPITRCGDPFVAITPQGTAVFVALGRHAKFPQQREGSLVTFRSTDGGRTWTHDPVGLGAFHDRPTIAVDGGAPTRRSSLYVISGQGIRDKQGAHRRSVFVARSRTAGASFDEPVSLIPSNLSLNAELPVALSDGTLIVSFVDFERHVLEDDRQEGRLDRPRNWVQRSTDGGKTFSVPLYVNENCGPDWSALVADTSGGPFRNRVYHACMRRQGGAITLNYSSNRGESWTMPRLVHSIPTDTAVVRKMPMLAVNKNGVLGVAWIDGRNRPGTRCYDVYFSASTDGGQTFVPEQRVSSVTSCPDVRKNGAAFTRWPRGGDYHGMAAAADGRFHVFWGDARDGVFQLRTAAITVGGERSRP
jgi:hypothetical protein